MFFSKLTPFRDRQLPAPFTLRGGLDVGSSQSCLNGTIRTAAYALHPVFMRIRGAKAEESMGLFA
jgi:hypothetical protein